MEGEGGCEGIELQAELESFRAIRFTKYLNFRDFGRGRLRAAWTPRRPGDARGIGSSKPERDGHEGAGTGHGSEGLPCSLKAHSWTSNEALCAKMPLDAPALTDSLPTSPGRSVCDRRAR